MRLVLPLLNVHKKHVGNVQKDEAVKQVSKDLENLYIRASIPTIRDLQYEKREQWLRDNNRNAGSTTTLGVKYHRKVNGTRGGRKKSKNGKLT